MRTKKAVKDDGRRPLPEQLSEGMHIIGPSGQVAVLVGAGMDRDDQRRWSFFHPRTGVYGVTRITQPEMVAKGICLFHNPSKLKKRWRKK